MHLPERGYVRLLGHASTRPDGHPRKTHAQVPMRLAFAMLVLSALVTPAGALDEPCALAHAPSAQPHSTRLPIGFFVTFLLFIGQYAVAFSGTLVGPLMGITSVLWLMMRNDAAIDPSASWM
jgi:hypothetical protein